MPFIQVDVDAPEAFEQVAEMARVPPGDVYRGFTRLWLYCWKAKALFISRERLQAFFPCENFEGLVRAAVVCEFLTPVEGQGGALKVRGAEKRLGVLRAQKKAAEQTNKKRWGSDGGSDTVSDGSSDETPIAQPISQASVDRPLNPSVQVALTSRSPEVQKSISPVVVEARRPPPRKLPGIRKVEKPSTPRDKWTQQEFEHWAQYTRQRAGLVPEDSPPIFELERWWAVAIAWTDGQVQPLCDAFIRFGEDEHWKAAKPPVPFRGFMSQWDRYMQPREAAHAP